MVSGSGVAAGTELLHVSGAVCKATMLVFLVALHMSAWLIVAVTADRFLAVTHPLQVRTSGRYGLLHPYRLSRDTSRSTLSLSQRTFVLSTELE